MAQIGFSVFIGCYNSIEIAHSFFIPNLCKPLTCIVFLKLINLHCYCHIVLDYLGERLANYTLSSILVYLPAWTNYKY
jgi:hypothetical protein